MGTVRLMGAEELEDRTAEFATMLRDCVLAGASINFVLPLPIEEAAAFWTEKVAPGLRRGTRLLWVVEVESRVIGTVQLEMDMPPNQTHRADVLKLMVDPSARRAGHARQLMMALEDEARGRGLGLLTLDTKTGDGAEALYRSLGFHELGVIPDYALDPSGTRLEAATFFYKRLTAELAV